MVTLYKRDHKGAMRFWSIEKQELDSNQYASLVIRFGQVGGEEQEQVETVEPNEFRDLDEQCESRMNSRINKKKDKGYIEDMEKAKYKADTNILGFHKPMLATKYDNVKYDIDFGKCTYQFKYDGHRCLITKHEGKLIAYSRGGKLIDTIDHILEGIDIPEGVTLDGELYAHGHKLQTISSWIKRAQLNTKKINYHCYDVVSDAHYDERASMMETFSYGDNAGTVPQFRYKHGINYMLNTAIESGFEGLIIRTPDCGYEGKRSKSLIKVKKFFDKEFIVTGIFESRDGWAILECAMDNGTKFRVSSPGAVPFKMYVLNNKDKFIGKHVTVEYANYTADGVPFHPVATMFRDTGEIDV